MNGKSLGRSVAAVSVVAVMGAVLAGCGHKVSEAAAPPPSNTKMGTDYAQGLAKMHSQQNQAPQAGAAPNHP